MPTLRSDSVHRIPTIASLALLLVIGACADNEDLVGPPTRSSDDPLRALLLDAGFRADMIDDQGERFVVEGDIVISKDALRRTTGEVEIRPGVPQADLQTQQYRTTQTVASAYAERVVVNLSALDAAAPDWASAARLALQDWNVVWGSWLRFVEGASADIYIVTAGLPTNTAGLAKFPVEAAVSGKPGDTIWVNPNFAPQFNTAATRRRNVAHELGHAVGLRHTNWSTQETALPFGAIFIGGTVENDPASVMNGGTADHPWNGFSANDVIAIRTLYSGPSVAVNGPTHLNQPGYYSWSGIVTGGSGQFTYTWVRLNACGLDPNCYDEPYVVGSGLIYGFSHSGGPHFSLTLVVHGIEGQVKEQFHYIMVQ